MSRRKHLLALVESLERRQLLAASWFVSPSGHDTSTGAIGSPFLTVAKALTVAQSGDTINLRAGTYAGNLKVTRPNLIIQGYATEAAKISSPTNDPSIEVTIDFGTEASGCTLRNLELTGGYIDTIKTETTRQDDTNGIYHGCNHLLFDTLKVHDAGTHVIKLVPDSDHVTIRNCEIYNSGKRDATQGQGVDAVNIDDFLFEKNYIHDTTQNAIFVKGGSQRAMIQDNEIRNAGFGGILIGQDTSAEFFDTRQNPAEYEAIDCVAQRNRISNTNDAALAAWSSLRTIIQNNFARDVGLTGQAGFYIATNAVETHNQDVTFKNNTIGVSTGRVAVMRADDGFAGKLTMSGNRYFGENHFIDEGSEFQGTLAQWQSHIGGDSASTFSSGKPPFPADLNRDGDLDVDDYLVMDSAYVVNGWTADLNIDGKVNLDDYVVIDSAVGAAHAQAPLPAPATTMAIASDPAVSFENPLSIARLSKSLDLLA